MLLVLVQLLLLLRENTLSKIYIYLHDMSYIIICIYKNRTYICFVIFK